MNHAVPSTLPYEQQQPQRPRLDGAQTFVAHTHGSLGPPPPPHSAPHAGMMQWSAQAPDYRHHPYPPIPQQHYYPHYPPLAQQQHPQHPQHMAQQHMAQQLQQQIPQLPRRVRCTQACNHCHRRKARCVRNMLPDGSVRCDNCIREGIVCEWRESRRRGPKRRAKDEAVPPQSRNAASIANLLNAAGGDGANVEAGANAGANLGNAAGSDGANSSGGSADPPEPGSRAARRAGRTQHYVLPSSRRPEHVQAPAAGDLVERFMALADVELREAVLAYYAYFYGFCPILHPSTLLRKVVEGTLDPLLDDSLRATTSMFVGKKLGRTIDADALFSRLVTAITIRPSAPSVDEVCAFQLASIGVSGVRGFVCFDTLKSAVTSLLMQLNWHELDRYEPAAGAAPVTWAEWVEAEVKRRVFWINYKIDSHHAGIAGRPPVIDEDKVFVRAPCSDAEWDELSREVLVRGCCCDGAAPAAYPDGPWSATSDSSGDESPAAGPPGAGVSDAGPSDAGHTTTCHGLVEGVQEELSRSFRMITPYESFMARISTLQRDAKAAWVQQCSGGDAPHVPLLGESPLFRRYDAEIRAWRADQVVASALRDPTLPPWTASFFGSLRHRIFLVRVRYYCINIYAPGVTILLHAANRRSFFTEAQHTLAAQSRDASTSPPLGPRASEPAKPEDEQIARILNQTFGPTWCQGLVATDIAPPSWALSVACAHELADVLRANSDIPLEFLDMVIPLFLFVGITVLLRQIRRCQAQLAAEPTDAAARAELDRELKLSLRDAQALWQAIRDMGSVWRIDGISKLLASMHIDEVEKAAEQLASISL